MTVHIDALAKNRKRQSEELEKLRNENRILKKCVEYYAQGIEIKTDMPIGEDDDFVDGKIKTGKFAREVQRHLLGTNN